MAATIRLSQQHSCSLDHLVCDGEEVDDVSSGGVSTMASLGGRLGTFESGFG
jgi:hypothetical protein